MSTLEALNIDNWKFFLKNGKDYVPKDFKSGAQKVFSFSNLLFIVKKAQPNYYLYLGSKTVPPCDGKITC